MNRICALAWFFATDLFRSLAGIVPPAIALTFGIIAFEYGMDQAQFITVAGVGVGAICLLTTLILSSRANRASSYLLVTRLHRRSELLVSLILTSLGITTALAILIASGNLLAGRLTLDFPSVLWILPTWMPLWLLAGALALPLSSLVSRGGSHMLSYVLLAVLLIVNDQKAVLASQGLDWLGRGATVLLWPVSRLLAQASSGIHDRSYWLAGALTLTYAGLLLAMAIPLFKNKDLLWSE
ncbi:MAG: hypothetical protein P8189_02140 [Anaerolineae bacterium]|jgi:hypothetical protein